MGQCICKVLKLKIPYIVICGKNARGQTQGGKTAGENRPFAKNKGGDYQKVVRVVVFALILSSKGVCEGPQLAREKRSTSSQKSYHDTVLWYCIEEAERPVATAIDIAGLLQVRACPAPSSAAL